MWEGAYVLSMLGLLIWLAGRFFSDPHPEVRALADASYTIYLFHWPIMALCYEALYSPFLPPTLTFFVLIVTAGAMSYWIHVNIVQRWWVCRWLLNGTIPAAATGSRELVLRRILPRQTA
jgi:glucan biosynthesis protein C